MVRSATPSDADALARIYNHCITQTIVTFEEEPVAPGGGSRWSGGGGG